MNIKNFSFQETEGVKVDKVCRGQTIHSHIRPFSHSNVRMDGLTPIDFVNLYLTDEFWTLLVTETTQFAQQVFATNPSNTYTRLWTAVDVKEMKSFIALLLLMGVNHKLSLPMYWSLDDFLYTLIFSQIMTRNRFYLILRFLHFSNNEDPLYDINDENRDRPHKV